MDKGYSNHTPDAIPGFTIPLTDKQIMHLGRLTVMWGQIDFLLDHAMDKVFDLSPQRRAALIGEKPIGAKLKLIKKGLLAMDEGSAKTSLKAFVDALDGVVNERNHACHGVWSWRANTRTKKVSVTARAANSPSTPLRPEKLNSLVKRVAECSRLGMIAFATVTGSTSVKLPARLYHGSSETPPDWLSELS